VFGIAELQVINYAVRNAKLRNSGNVEEVRVQACFQTPECCVIITNIVSDDMSKYRPTQ
jgi:hypothetical protein